MKVNNPFLASVVMLLLLSVGTACADSLGLGDEVNVCGKAVKLKEVYPDAAMVEVDGESALIAQQEGALVNGVAIIASSLNFDAKSADLKLSCEEDKPAEDIRISDDMELFAEPADDSPPLIVPIDGSAECSDSDFSLFFADGKAYSVKGATKGILAGSNKAKTFEDYCLAPKELIEYFCTVDGFVQFNKIVCPNGCNDGLCGLPPYCYDTDGGNYGEKKGRLFVVQESHSDAPEDLLVAKVESRVQKKIRSYKYAKSDFGKVKKAEIMNNMGVSPDEEAEWDALPKPRGSDIPLKDECIDTKTLKEYSCDENDNVGAYYSEIVECPEKCAGGRCVAAEEEVEEEVIEEIPDFEILFGESKMINGYLALAEEDRISLERDLEGDNALKAGQNTVEDSIFSLIAPSIILEYGQKALVDGYTAVLSDWVIFLDKHNLELNEGINSFEGSTFSLAVPSFVIEGGDKSMIGSYMATFSDGILMLDNTRLTLYPGESTVEGKTFGLIKPGFTLTKGEIIPLGGYSVSVSSSMNSLVAERTIRLYPGENSVEGIVFNLQEGDIRK
ncbi:MAG: hypothetical protein ABIB71_01925 [Candidatus Woesearchaeota archaeon]